MKAPRGEWHMPPAQLHPPGGTRQKQEELQSCSLQKGDYKHSKFAEMRRQRNSFQMKEQDKNPQEQLNEEETDNLPEKIIQSNDSKDDPRSQKKNGGMGRYKKCLAKN